MRNNLQTLSRNLPSACLAFATTAGSGGPDFLRKIRSVLFNRCVDCHRPGEIAPRS